MNTQPNTPSPLKNAWNRLVHGQSGQSPLVTLASSLGAIVIALVIAGVFLLITGKNPIDAYSKMLSAGITKVKFAEAADRAIPLVLAAVAVAIGFSRSHMRHRSGTDATSYTTGVKKNPSVKTRFTSCDTSRYSTLRPATRRLTPTVAAVPTMSIGATNHAVGATPGPNQRASATSTTPEKRG